MQRLIKKAINDIWQNGKRTVLAFTAMTFGMIFFGLMLFSNIIMTREIKSVYQKRNPASASLELMGNQDISQLEHALSSMQDIETFEFKAVSKTQVQVGENDWKQAYIFGIAKDKQINQIKITDGQLSSDEGTAIIETGAVSVAGQTMGDSIITKNELGIQTEYKLTGVANDMSVHPAIVHGCVYLYVLEDQMQSNQIDGYYLELKTIHPYNREEIEKVCQELAGKIKQSGYQITEINIPDQPGESMHAGEYDSTMLILRLFSFVALLFGAMITANLISAIMDSQMKQIGILKSVGTKISQIYAAYMIAFGLHFVGCVSIAMMVVNIVSKYFSILMLRLSDIIPENTTIALTWNLIFFAVCTIVPIMIVSVPLIRGSRITVKQAFDHHGISQDSLNHTGSKLRFKSRPLMLSVRNVFRKKKRLALNIGLLTFGGIVFIGINTVNLSLRADLDQYMSSLNYNYQFQVGKNETEESLKEKLNTVEEIQDYEIWGSSYCSFWGSDGVERICTITTPQEATQMMTPTMLEGSWIEEDTDREIVISEELSKEQGFKTGDRLKLSIMGKEDTFTIKGVIKEFEKKEIFFSQDLLMQYTGIENWSYNVKCVTNSMGATTRQFNKMITASLENSGIIAVAGEDSTQMKETLFNHFSVTLNSCLVVSILLIFVAGFGLSASMSVQAEERKKEIGILKAVGTGKKDIYRMFLVEGNVLSIAGDVVTLPISLCTAVAGCMIFGKYVFDKAIQFDLLSFLISCVIWFGFSFFVCHFAVKTSAKRNSNLTIKEVQAE